MTTPAHLLQQTGRTLSSKPNTFQTRNGERKDNNVVFFPIRLLSFFILNDSQANLYGGIYGNQTPDLNDFPQLDCRSTLSQKHQAINADFFAFTLILLPSLVHFSRPVLFFLNFSLLRLTSSRLLCLNRSYITHHGRKNLSRKNVCSMWQKGH